MTISYRVVKGSVGPATLTVFNTTNRDYPAILIADENHLHYSTILEGVRNDDESVYSLFEVGAGISKRLEKISSRVSWNGSEVLWDGDPVHSVIANQIARAVEHKESNIEAMAFFWEKLESNPNDHSKEQAYTWLATHDFKITAEGDVVGYKGVRAFSDGSFGSINTSGVAYVDGEEKTGSIPNPIGAEVTMPRSEVKHDPTVACHKGLHVGDWSYASDFAEGAVLEVHVNPRDIVSVPSDSYCRKVRTCKYKVVRVVTEEYSGGPVLKPVDVEPTWEGDVGYKV